ncbi:hypothetical protein FHETE_9586 [Fusarium heterosporum]|uniref:N-acetyltransferase domain-containing protein n=1 Tax=Fusarium heterosporum TaxID=42747 RepID=A0A8H5SXT7_FUSHE|nr:hypothetical protein FHETE_9586 [Fusarium heterosporum]
MASTKSNIKIVRISSLEEAEQLVDLACETFIDDYLFSLIVPGRHDHPESFRKIWKSYLREAYAGRGSVTLAAYREDEDGARSEFLAFAVWARFGTSDVARSWQGDSWNKKLARVGLLWDQCLQSILCQTDPGVTLDAAPDIFSSLSSTVSLHPKEHWSLSWLGVSPKCQRTGIGQRLLQWGIDRCEEEQVPALLLATAPGRPLYAKMGFQDLGDTICHEGGNVMMIRPVEGVVKMV